MVDSVVYSIFFSSLQSGSSFWYKHVTFAIRYRVQLLVTIAKYPVQVNWAGVLLTSSRAVAEHCGTMADLVGFPVSHDLLQQIVPRYDSFMEATPERWHYWQAA